MTRPSILIEIICGEYEGWRGGLIGLVRTGKIAADNIWHVKISPPPGAPEESVVEQYLPQGWIKEVRHE